MNKKRPRLRIAPEPKTLPIIQGMPGRRFRLDPSIIPDLVCWLVCASKQWETASKMTLRGLRGVARAKVLGARRHADLALAVVQSLINRVGDSWPIDDHEAAKADWVKHIEAALWVQPQFAPHRPTTEPDRAG